MDPDQRAPHQGEVLDHQLSESIVWVVHLVIKEKGKVELLVKVRHEVVHLVSVDVAEHTFRVKEGGSGGVDLMLF